MSKHAFNEDEVIVELRTVLDDLVKINMDRLPPVVELQSLDTLNLNAIEAIEQDVRQQAVGKLGRVVQPAMGGASNGGHVSEATGFRQQPIVTQTPPEVGKQQKNDPQGRRPHKPVPKTPPEQGRQHLVQDSRQQKDFPNVDARTGLRVEPPARR